MVAISLIVPVYNAQEYLGECLTSLVEQDFDQQYEVILIDDASSDASATVCQQFSTKTYARVSFHYLRLAHNSGVSKARNEGLAQVKGKYFSFVDADDMFFENSLTLMYRFAEEQQASILVANVTKVNQRGEEVYLSRKLEKHDGRVFKDGQGFIELLKRESIDVGVYAKLYLSNDFKHLTMPENYKFAEDFAFNMQAFSLADTVLLKNHSVYRYRQHANSTSSGMIQNKHYIDWMSVVDDASVYAQSRYGKLAVSKLKLITLLQIVRELRKNSAQDIKHALFALEACAKRWVNEICQQPMPFRARVNVWYSLWRYRSIYNRLRAASLTPAEK